LAPFRKHFAPPGAPSWLRACVDHVLTKQVFIRFGNILCK